MKLKLNINNLEEMNELGICIGLSCMPKMVFAFNGDLGAGKTTLTKSIGLGLDIKKTINSPTFTIMKVYEGRLKLYHLDVYRLESSGSDFDLEEYFDLNGVCIVEWAQIIDDLLPLDKISLDIRITGITSREITIDTNNQEFINKFLENIKEKINYEVIN